MADHAEGDYVHFNFDKFTEDLVVKSEVETRLDYLEDKVRAGFFEVEFEVLEETNPPSLLILSTYGGKKVDPEIDIKGFNQKSGEVSPVNFSTTQLESGTTLAKLMDDVSHLFVTATVDRDVEQTYLIPLI